MKIIISPAKKMNVDTDTLPVEGMPVFLKETEQLMRWIQSLSFAEVQKLWACNEKIAELNYRRFREMDLQKNLTPAILSYEGIQYQYMAPMVFTEQELAYVQKNLRMLSGFYGVLRPMDGVTPYRLEMQAKVKIPKALGTNAGKEDPLFYESLYEFWGARLYREVLDDSRIIINLASKEYSKCIERYLTPQDTYITCIFGELQGEKVVQKGTLAKMARGEMVRFMAENHMEDPEQIKKFHRLGYVFRPDLSTDCNYVFIKTKDGEQSF